MVDTGQGCGISEAFTSFYPNTTSHRQAACSSINASSPTIVAVQMPPPSKAQSPMRQYHQSAQASWAVQPTTQPHMTACTPMAAQCKVVPANSGIQSLPYPSATIPTTIDMCPVDFQGCADRLPEAAATWATVFKPAPALPMETCPALRLHTPWAARVERQHAKAERREAITSKGANEHASMAGELSNACVIWQECLGGVHGVTLMCE